MKHNSRITTPRITTFLKKFTTSFMIFNSICPSYPPLYSVLKGREALSVGGRPELSQLQWTPGRVQPKRRYEHTCPCSIRWRVQNACGRWPGAFWSSLRCRQRVQRFWRGAEGVLPSLRQERRSTTPLYMEGSANKRS